MVSNQFLVAVLSSAPQGSAGVKPVSAAGIRDANAVHSTATLFPGAPDNCPKLRHIEMRHLLSPLRYLAVECWGTDFKDEGIFFGFMLLQHWFIFSAKARVYQVHFCIATFSLVFNTPGEYASDSLVSWRADSRPFKTRSTNGKSMHRATEPPDDRVSSLHTPCSRSGRTPCKLATIRASAAYDKNS